MLNLIDQSNILKGFDDTTLQREMAQPSGSVPPFLVLSEISRRKDMRQRYTGEVANKAPKTTVMEDVMAAPAMPGMGPMGAPPAGGSGIAAVAQMGAPPAGGPGFASGGIVDAADPFDYRTLAQKYQTDLDSLPADRSQAQALALLATGAGILGGGHSNLGQNLGAGIAAGLGSYQDALKTTDLRETNALRGLSDLAHDQHGDALARLQEADRMNPNSPANTPQSIREIEYINAMPDGPEKDAAMAVITPYAAQTAAGKKADAEQQAQMIHDGTLMPPTSLGMGGQGGAIQAAFGRMFPGENLAQLQLDAKAAQAWATHMNSSQIIKQQSNISTANDQLTNLQSLADKWKAGQFPLLNSATFHTALQGGLGPGAQTLAAQFQQQLAETKLSMQQVFAGGYAGTDKQLGQIDTMFSTAAPQKTFDDLISLARTNIAYREKALGSPQAAGTGGIGTNTYVPGGDAAPAAGTTSTNVPFTIEP